MDGLNQKTSSNGCGACGGFWYWFRPPHHNFFKVQCNIHDIRYSEGGKERERHFADIELYYNMIDYVNEYFKDRKPLSRRWYIMLCKIYYYGVRIFGKSSFNYEKN